MKPEDAAAKPVLQALTPSGTRAPRPYFPSPLQLPVLPSWWLHEHPQISPRHQDVLGGSDERAHLSSFCSAPWGPAVPTEGDEGQDCVWGQPSHSSSSQLGWARPWPAP